MVDIIRKIYDADRKIDAYSPLLGKCEMTTDGKTIRIGGKGGAFTLDKCGRMNADGECLVFPDNWRKCWDFWQIRIMKPGDIVCCEEENKTVIVARDPDECEKKMWVYDVYGNHYETPARHTRFASAAEKACFIETFKTNGFSWDGKDICVHRVNLSDGAWYVCTGVPKIPGSRYTVGKAYMFRDAGFRDDSGRLFGFGGDGDTPNLFRPWTEDDAKAGDILVDAYTRTPFIASGKTEDGRPCAAAGVNPVTGEFSRDCKADRKWSDNPSEPARPEEIVELMADMHRAHMVWDASVRQVLEFGVGSRIKYNGGKFRVTGFDDTTIFVCSPEPDGDSPTGISYSADISLDRYTIDELKPFDKVLVRNGKFAWTASLFSHVNKDYTASIYVCVNGNTYSQCVPYNETTAHLVGTTDSYYGEYKTW